MSPGTRRTIPAAPAAGSRQAIVNIRPDNRQRRKVILLALLFAAPLIAALALRLTGWQPGATGNHGDLVEPAVELPAGAVPDTLRGHWLLVGLVPSDCREECDSLVQDLLRVRQALGKDGHRIRLVLAGPDSVPGDINAAPLYPAPPSMRSAFAESGSAAGRRAGDRSPGFPGAAVCPRVPCRGSARRSGTAATLHARGSPVISARYSPRENRRCE